MGQSFRISHLRRALRHMMARPERVWICLPREIARHYAALSAEQQLQP